MGLRASPTTLELDRQRRKATCGVAFPLGAKKAQAPTAVATSQASGPSTLQECADVSEHVQNKVDRRAGKAHLNY
jgi:hypothetical protein